MSTSNNNKVCSHHDATYFHEEHVIDLIVVSPMSLYICIDINVVVDGGGCYDVYGEDGYRLVVDSLGKSQPQPEASVIRVLVAPPAVARLASSSGE